MFINYLVRRVPPDYSNISVEAWISTLKLSTMWEITALRELAISNLSKLDVIDMILLGSEFLVAKWFFAGCTKLVMRLQGPTEEEGNRLGVGFIVKIYGLRERMLSYSGRPAHFDFQRVLRETFSDKTFI